jgi:hypothetical protein
MAIEPQTIIVVPDTQEDYIVVDRTITENQEPKFNTNILVTEDNKSNRLYFNMYYTFDDRELADKEICILWENANHEKGISLCTEKTLTDDRLTFAWDVPVDVTYIAGTISFAIRITANNYIWNSLIGHAEVRQGIHYDEDEPALAPTGWVNYIQDKYSTTLKSLSKADYTSLTPKDNNTMYVVINPDTSVELYLGETKIGLKESYYDDFKAVIEGTATTLIIPEGITKIKQSLFAEVSTLTSVTLPHTLTTIGSWAFEETGLTSITIPNSIISWSAESFRGCSNLITVTVEEGIDWEHLELGSNIFASNDYNSALRTVNLPNDMTFIGIGMFYGQGNLTSIVLPQALKIIKGSAFEHTGLRTITFPDALETIAPDAFDHSSLGGTIIIPNSVTTLGEYAFRETSITTVYIGAAGDNYSNINSIGSYTFANSPITDIYINLPSTQTQITVPSNKWGATNATIHWADE